MVLAELGDAADHHDVVAVCFPRGLIEVADLAPDATKAVRSVTERGMPDRLVAAMGELGAGSADLGGFIDIRL